MRDAGQYIPWLRRLLKRAASEDIDACLIISVAWKDRNSIDYIDVQREREQPKQSTIRIEEKRGNA